jgi:heme/copper-type cytochrome/quinol oxidase subunit 4
MKIDMMYLWGIIPLVIIQLGLILYCLLDWLKRKQFRWMSKWVWLVLFVCINFIGAILYIILIKNSDDN